jgi:predicted GNAT family acetyltransferase
MQLVRFAEAAAFYQHAREFLMRHEAAHCLPIGICNTLMAQPDYSPEPPYLATVKQDDRIIATAVRTAPYNVVLSLIPEVKLTTFVIARLVDDLRVAYGDTLPGVIGPKDESHAFALRWQRETGQTYKPGTKELLYQLTQVQSVAGVPGCMRHVSEDDRELLVRWYDAFVREALPGEAGGVSGKRWANLVLSSPTQLRGVYLWEDGAAVSLAGYTGPTPHGMRIGPVYTPSEHRGKGYARALTAAVSQRLLDGGRQFVFLFTDLANPTSNYIYQAIGYRPVYDVDVYEFQR